MKDISRGYWLDDAGQKHALYVTTGWAAQAKKMLQEQGPTSLCKPEGITKVHSAEVLQSQELKFTFEQTGKSTASGTLTTSLDGTVIMLDSFDLTRQARRGAYVHLLRKTTQVPAYAYLENDLIRCLLEIAVEALAWDKTFLAKAEADKVEPVEKRSSDELNYDEMMAAYRANLKANNPPDVPRCYIEKIFHRSTL